MKHLRERRIVAYFKQLALIIISVIGFAISFAVSVWMYPHIYNRRASKFSKLRGGPGIGLTLAFINAFANLETLRIQARKKCLSTNDFILALSLSFLSVGAGVLAADMWRGWSKGTN